MRSDSRLLRLLIETALLRRDHKADGHALDLLRLSQKCTLPLTDFVLGRFPRVVASDLGQRDRNRPAAGNDGRSDPETSSRLGSQHSEGISQRKREVADSFPASAN